MKRCQRFVRAIRALAPFCDMARSEIEIILSSGRSGSTWLAEVASAERDVRLIFGPLHPKVVPKGAEILNRHYFRVEDSYPHQKVFYDYVMRGSIRRAWTDRYNSAFKYKRRVIKMIRALPSAGWIAKTYPNARVARDKGDSDSRWSSKTKYHPTSQELEYAGPLLSLFKMERFLNDKNRATICTSFFDL